MVEGNLLKSGWTPIFLNRENFLDGMCGANIFFDGLSQTKRK